LERLEEIYTGLGDKWRQYAYRKAVGVLKRHPKAITTVADAVELGGVPGMGAKMVTKIVEIVKTGACKRRTLYDPFSYSAYETLTYHVSV
jgi:DNA polymerase/3'-5' exonuclease PolX